MSNGRHSYVAFYPSDWVGGTARMTRLHKSVYFDVCCYIWDKAEPCPAGELPLMLGDLGNWRDLIEDLIAAGKLVRSPDGSVANSKALDEANKALALWEKKSKGGKDGASKTNNRRTPAESVAATPVSTPAASPVESEPGLPTQNQNQNQNQLSVASKEATAAVAADPWKQIYNGFKKHLGTKSGGVVSRLKAVSSEDELKLWLEMLERNEIAEPREYFSAVIAKREAQAVKPDVPDPVKAAEAFVWAITKGVHGRSDPSTAQVVALVKAGRVTIQQGADYCRERADTFTANNGLGDNVSRETSDDALLDIPDHLRREVGEQARGVA